MEKLTKERHRDLTVKGYKFFLLKDVTDISSIPASYFMQPVKTMPASHMFSCLGIQDGMILSFLDGDSPHITIYVEEIDVR